jgi:hypothetical protein
VRHRPPLRWCPGRPHRRGWRGLPRRHWRRRDRGPRLRQVRPGLGPRERRAGRKLGPWRERRLRRERRAGREGHGPGSCRSGGRLARPRSSGKCYGRHFGLSSVDPTGLGAYCSSLYPRLITHARFRHVVKLGCLRREKPGDFRLRAANRAARGGAVPVARLPSWRSRSATLEEPVRDDRYAITAYGFSFDDARTATAFRDAALATMRARGVMQKPGAFPRSSAASLTCPSGRSLRGCDGASPRTGDGA